jgi:hypothetical protein
MDTFTVMQTDDHAFNQFDPSLGTLNKITMDLTATSELDESFTATTGGAPSVSFSADVTTFETKLTSTVFSVTDTHSNLSTSVSSTTDITSGTSSTFGPFNFSANATNTGSNPPPFVGIGTIAVDFEIDIDLTLNLMTGASVTDSITPTFDPTLTVTYDFTSNVPEPNSLAILTASLIGVGWLRRRRTIN